MFWPLKLYFQYQEKCLLFILNFFENLMSEVRLYFVHSQTSSFHESVKKEEGRAFTVLEVFDSTETRLDVEINLRIVQ